jgi:hypothetical protein
MWGSCAFMNTAVVSARRQKVINNSLTPASIAWSIFHKCRFAGLSVHFSRTSIGAFVIGSGISARFADSAVHVMNSRQLWGYVQHGCSCVMKIFNPKPVVFGWGFWPITEAAIHSSQFDGKCNWLIEQWQQLSVLFGCKLRRCQYIQGVRRTRVVLKLLRAH